MGKIKFVKINLDENLILGEESQIMSTSNMLILRDGKIISHFIGYHQKEQVQVILNKHM
ncbi:thioredoxin family protein [Clostridium simiarum]|uniref:thioredoxin family protein n=1 Tax=Clostridium simiarum TaxID=2841506 RepID=UPI003CCE6A17